MPKTWQRKTFNQHCLAILADDQLIAGCLATDSVEPYSGERQYSLSDFLIQDDSQAVRISEFIASQWPQTRFASVVRPPGGELSGFQCVQLDLRWQLPSQAEIVPFVRGVEEHELPEIRSLAKGSLPELLCYPPGLPAERVVRFCRAHNPTVTQQLEPSDERFAFLSARHDGGPLLGYVVVDLDPDEPWLNDICVAPSARGGKVARALLKAAAAKCLEEGSTQLFATVSAQNTRSWRPALRVGFEVQSERWLRSLTDSSN